MWAVVNFTSENTVEAVPVKWIIRISQECFWPPKQLTRKKIREAIQNCIEPDADWNIFQIRILGEYDNFNKALIKAAKATMTTDLSSAADEYEPPNKKHRKEYSSSDEPVSSEDDSLPYPVLNPVATEKKTIVKTSGAKKSFSVSSREVTPAARKSLTQSFFENDAEIRTEKKKYCNNQHDNDTPAARKSLTQSFFDNDAEICTEKKKYNNDQNDNDTDFKKQILRQLYVIRNLMQQQTDSIDILLKRNTSNVTMNNVENEEFTACTKMFPLKSENDLEYVEIFLNDEANMDCLAKYLSRIGGNTVKEIIRRIMYSVFCNEIGILFSWEGAKKKKIFKNLKISTCLLNAVRLNARTSSAQDDEIIREIKGWLVRSRDRLLQKQKKNEDGEK